MSILFMDTLSRRDVPRSFAQHVARYLVKLSVLETYANHLERHHPRAGAAAATEQVPTPAEGAGRGDRAFGPNSSTCSAGHFVGAAVRDSHGASSHDAAHSSVEADLIGSESAGPATILSHAINQAAAVGFEPLVTTLLKLMTRHIKLNESGPGVTSRLNGSKAAVLDSAVRAAAANGHASCIEALLNAGASLRAGSGSVNHPHPVHLAVQCGSIAATKVIMESDPDAVHAVSYLRPPLISQSMRCKLLHIPKSSTCSVLRA